MSNSWPVVPLGEALRLSIDAVPVDPSASYPIAGVYSFGRGLLSRSPLLGSQTTYKVLHRLHKDDFVLSQLKGWEGALAKVPQSYDGWFLSPQFPTFRANAERLEVNYLAWYSKQPKVWEALRNTARGMGARRDSVSPERFLALKIPLPALSEQRRIVARIEELAAKIEEARGLRKQTVEQAGFFVTSLHLKMAQGRVRKLEEILKLEEEQEEVQAGQKYPQVGVRGFGQGLFRKETLDGVQTTYRVFNRLYEGAVVLSQVKGWEGAISVCPPDLAGLYVSPEYRTFRCISGEALPEYLAVLFATAWFWTQLKHVTRGVGARRERTRPEQFLKMELPLPSLKQQTEALPIFHEVHDLKRLQVETAAELDAMLPSILDKAFRGELV